MHRALRWFVALLLAVAATGANAAEIVLEQPAVEKLLTQALFAGGRFNLQTGTCYAYLETPSAELKDGRIRLRTHLSARLGVDVAGSCVGAGLASWTVVSGRPTSSGGTVKLEDVRIDSVDDGPTRLLLQSGLVPALPNAIELDVLKAVRTMLQGSSQFQVTVDSFNIESAAVVDSHLSVKFNFKLVAR